jgi:transcriptional regulator with XRE-family HTH domain
VTRAPGPVPGPSIGELLVNARRQAGWSQDELARRAGLKLDTLRAIEQGRTLNPGVLTMRAVARALGVSLDSLVPR